MKYLQYIGFLALSLLIASCSNSKVSDSSDSGSTEVAVTIGERSGGGSPAQGPELFPASVESFEFSVTGPNMSPLGQVVDLQPGQTSLTVIFIVPNGPNRCFAINALNAVGGLAYSGVSCVDIDGGTPIVTVYMQQECYLYVDVNIGDDSANDCTDPNNPCQTITRALTQTAGDEAICVAAGTYDDTNETFPLDLLAGTSLICQGAGYSTIIDDSGTAINGAAGALIQGCTILGEPAIDDLTTATTVNDCLIDGNSSSNCDGMYLSGNSIILNSTIQDFSCRAIEISGSGSPTITNNTITGSDVGIYVGGSANPTINLNRIYCNTDHDLETNSSSTINAINNSWDHDSTTVPTGPTIENEWSFCSSGVDICYWGGGYGTPPPSYMPILPAVPGGCL